MSGKDGANRAPGNDASTTSSGKSSGSTETPKAKSGENGGTTGAGAAGVGYNSCCANAIPTLPHNRASTTSGGAVSLHTSSDADATAKAKATAVKPKTANIGAAV